MLYKYVYEYCFVYPFPKLETSKTTFSGDSQSNCESRIDESCTNEGLAVTSTQNEYNNASNLPSQTTLQDDVQDNNILFPLKEPKLFYSSLPTMVDYGQTRVLRFPETTTQKVTLEVQSQEEFPVEQSSCLRPDSVACHSYTTTSQCRVQSNLADTWSNVTGFHSNESCSDPAELQCCIDDSRLQPTVAFPRHNLHSFQPDFTGSRTNPITFRSDDVNSWSTLTGYDHTTDSHFGATNFESNFVHEPLNYFPRLRILPSNTETRNMECSGRNIHNPIINRYNTQQPLQTLMPLYISDRTPSGNAMYYTPRLPSASPSPFTIATRDYHVFAPIERLGCENIEIQSVHSLNSSAMISKQERENTSLEESSNFWSTEERPSWSFQYYDSNVTSSPDMYLRSSVSPNNAEFDHSTTSAINESQVGAVIKKEEKSSCRFLVSPPLHTLTNSSYSSPYERLSNSCPSYAQDQLQFSMSITDEIDRAYTIPPAFPTSPIPTVYPIPVTHPTPAANLTTPAHTTTAMPLNINVEGSAKFESLSETEEASNSSLTAFYNSPQAGQICELHDETSECADLVNKPLTREERKRKILSAFGFTNFEKPSSSSCKFRKLGKKETTSPNDKAEQVQGVQNISYDDPSGSPADKNPSGDEMDAGALSPNVVKAATILTNSKLQRWKTMRNLKPSSEGSPIQSLNETSTTKDSKMSGFSNTDQHQSEDSNRTKITQSKKGSDEQNVTSTVSSLPQSVDEGEKEFTVVSKSSTKRTVAIQVQSKHVKPLRRMCTHQHSTGSQTDMHTTSNETLLFGKNFAKCDNVEENKATSLRMSNPNASSLQLQNSATTDVANASCTELDNVVLVRLVRDQQATEESPSNVKTIKTFSQPLTDKTPLTNVDDINLRCDEVIVEDDVELNKEKSREEINVELNQQIRIKFVDDSKIFLKFQNEPLRFLTCF